MIQKIVIDNYARKYGISTEESINVFNRLEQFLETASKEIPIKPTNELDHAWHHFILHTKEYYKYCMLKYSKFIHHVPNLNGCESCSSDINLIAECEAQCQPDIELSVRI